MTEEMQSKIEMPTATETENPELTKPKNVVGLLTLDACSFISLFLNWYMGHGGGNPEGNGRLRKPFEAIRTFASATNRWRQVMAEFNGPTASEQLSWIGPNPDAKLDLFVRVDRGYLSLYATNKDGSDVLATVTKLASVSTTFLYAKTTEEDVCVLIDCVGQEHTVTGREYRRARVAASERVTFQPTTATLKPASTRLAACLELPVERQFLAHGFPSEQLDLQMVPNVEAALLLMAQGQHEHHAAFVHTSPVGLALAKTLIGACGTEPKSSEGSPGEDQPLQVMVLPLVRNFATCKLQIAPPIDPSILSFHPRDRALVLMGTSQQDRTDLTDRLRRKLSTILEASLMSFRH